MARLIPRAIDDAVVRRSGACETFLVDHLAVRGVPFGQSSRAAAVPRDIN